MSDTPAASVPENMLSNYAICSPSHPQSIRLCWNKHTRSKELLAVGLHGTVGAFDSSQSEYVEWLVHYFVANNIEAEDITYCHQTEYVQTPEDSRLSQKSRRVHVQEARSDPLQP